MAISDSSGLPIAIYIASASPHEVTTLAEATISAKCFITDEKPEHLVAGDKAYDR
jgi:hypothetical protein